MKKSFDVYLPKITMSATHRRYGYEEGIITYPEPREIELRAHKHIGCSGAGICRFDHRELGNHEKYSSLGGL